MPTANMHMWTHTHTQMCTSISLSTGVHDNTQEVEAGWRDDNVILRYTELEASLQESLWERVLWPLL